jgi:flagellar biogenesis protein FliO
MSAPPNATVPAPTPATVPAPEPATNSNPQPAEVSTAPSASQSNQGSVTGTGSGSWGGFATDLFTKISVFFIGIILLILGLVWALKQPMHERAAAAIDKAKSFAR